MGNALFCFSNKLDTAILVPATVGIQSEPPEQQVQRGLKDNESQDIFTSSSGRCYHRRIMRGLHSRGHVEPLSPLPRSPWRGPGFNNRKAGSPSSLHNSKSAGHPKSEVGLCQMSGDNILGRADPDFKLSPENLIDEDFGLLPHVSFPRAMELVLKTHAIQPRSRSKFAESP